MKLENFRQQYRDILINKQKEKFKRLNYYLLSGENPYKFGTVQSRIDDVTTNIKKLQTNDFEFNGFEFFGISSHSDKLIISIITNDINLYREATRFDNYEKIITSAIKFGYNKYIIVDDRLVDFYRCNDLIVSYSNNDVEIDVSKDTMWTKYQESLPTSRTSYYKSQHTRNGANMSYWNIGGVRVYD